MKIIKTTTRAACVRLEERYVPVFDAEFEKKFGVRVKTTWNFMQDAAVTGRDDGDDFTQEQMTWMVGFTDGWLAATDQIGAME